MPSITTRERRGQPGTARLHPGRKGGDDGTNDLMVSDVIRTNEAQAWFISEHLVDAPLTHVE